MTILLCESDQEVENIVALKQSIIIIYVTTFNFKSRQVLFILNYISRILIILLLLNVNRFLMLYQLLAVLLLMLGFALFVWPTSGNLLTLAFLLFTSLISHDVFAAIKQNVLRSIVINKVLQLGFHLCGVCNGCWASPPFDSLAGELVFEYLEWFTFFPWSETKFNDT